MYTRTTSVPCIGTRNKNQCLITIQCINKIRMTIASSLYNSTGSTNN